MTDTQDTHSKAPQRTPFYQSHIDSEGKLVDFSGRELPINYGSQIEEHDAVRTDAGMFDVSHMVVTDIKGADTKAWLQKLLANDVNKLTTTGKDSSYKDNNYKDGASAKADNVSLTKDSTLSKKADNKISEKR